MKKYLIAPLLFLFTYGNCLAQDYELLVPEGEQKGVLILFPGFPEGPDIIKREFAIEEAAMKAGVAVALMTFNRKLWLDEADKVKLASVVSRMLEEHDLNQDNVYIGGFSSGGNVALLLSNYLVESESPVQPQGVFVIDSPVDLLALYENSERNIDHNFSPVSVQESQMVVQLLESSLGKPENGINQYEQHSVYTGKTHNIDNLSSLEDVKIRLYTEPDTAWWKQNRMNEYEDMNAYSIKHLADDLTEQLGDQVEYIATENRGYRANGDRHPHAWSIVEVDKLIAWMMQ